MVDTQTTPTAPGRTTAAHVRTSATGRERVVALDGLRAFALLIIMGYHFGVGWLQGGLLQPGHLLRPLRLPDHRPAAGECAPGRPHQAGRLLAAPGPRLLPALLVVLVVVTLVVRFAYPPGLYPDFRMSALSALFYFSNWWQIAASGNYFVATGAVSPAHPHLVAGRGGAVLPGVAPGGAGRAPPREALLPGHRDAAGGLGGRRGGLGHRDGPALQPAANTTRLYFGTDTHAQSILVGAALACVLTLVQRRRGRVGMAPVATSPTARGPHRGGPGRAGRHLGPHLRADRHRGLRLPGRVPPSALSAAAIIVGVGVRARRAPGPGPVAAPHGVDGHRLLRRLPVALPGVHRARRRPDRPHRPGPAGRAVRHHLRPGRGQLLPGRAAGDGGDLLAVAAGGRGRPPWPWGPPWPSSWPPR